MIQYNMVGKKMGNKIRACNSICVSDYSLAITLKIVMSFKS